MSLVFMPRCSHDMGKRQHAVYLSARTEVQSRTRGLMYRDHEAHTARDQLREAWHFCHMTAEQLQGMRNLAYVVRIKCVHTLRAMR